MPSVPPAHRSRTVRALAAAGTALAIAFGAAAPAAAQVQLSGVSMFQIEPGSKAFVPTNTLVAQSTNPAAGLFGNQNYQLFVGPNGVGSLAADPLAPLTLAAGVNTFTFASVSYGVGSLPVALSLFFTAAPTTPGLTGYNTLGAASSAVQDDAGMPGYNAFTGATAGSPNSAFLTPNAGLIGTIGGFVVALTGFQFAESNIKYVQPGSINPTPGSCGSGACNWVGTFQVTVTPTASTVPEPSAYVLLASGLATVALVARRRRIPVDG